jgi:hypothetical protein
VIIRKTFNQVFAYLNVQLFNRCCYIPFQFLEKLDCTVHMGHQKYPWYMLYMVDSVLYQISTFFFV